MLVLLGGKYHKLKQTKTFQRLNISPLVVASQTVLSARKMRHLPFS